jgi:hypothetical protein
VYLIGMHLRVIYFTGMHLVGVYLMGMHLMDMHLKGVQSRRHTSAKSITDFWGAKYPFAGHRVLQFSVLYSAHPSGIVLRVTPKSR